MNYQVEVSHEEAQLIEELRKIPFGKVNILKQDGVIIRLESVVSKKLDPAKQLNIPAKAL